MAQAATSEYQGGGNKSPTNPTTNNRRAPPTARKTATPKQVPPERGRQKPREKMCEAHRDEVAPPASEASGTRGAGEKQTTRRKIRHKKKGRGTRGRPFDATRNEHRPETRNANPYRKPAQHTQHNTWDLQTQGAHIKNVRPSCMRPCEATSAWKVGYVSSRNEPRTGYRNVGTNRKPATELPSRTPDRVPSRKTPKRVSERKTDHTCLKPQTRQRLFTQTPPPRQQP